MREITLRDTRSGELRELEPRDPGRVGIYVCGPTVYGRIHVGNARPFVVFSVLKRFLEHLGYEVTLVINITDVNDKIYAAAAAQGRPSAQLADEMIAHYRADTDALGLGRPDHEPLASQTIGEIVDYIRALVDSGHAYEAGGDVYFRVRSDAQYGELSHRRPDDMDQGEDVEGAERKEDPLDFALWKAHKAGEDTFWDSPWGSGRPGWHIECSAMAEETLGLGFDIHGGGSDLIFPHHENEAAQTRAARGAELARLWVHNGMIQATGEKMAKSVGNITPLADVLAEHGREAVVMYLLSGHYRQPLAFSQSELHDAARRVHRIREAARALEPATPSPEDMREHLDAFYDALANDFNTPAALGALFMWVREANTRGGGVGDHDLREMLSVIGLESVLDSVGATGATGATGASHGGAVRDEVDEESLELLRAREGARAQRDFAAADAMREQLRARGWEIRDGPEGPRLIRIT
jgi:cysteinyl-tRNA synthetase